MYNARSSCHVLRATALSQVRAMVVTCPQLLLSDVRNVVVPSLQCMLQSTSDHDELATRLFRDPSLLVVGVGPLARLQYTLEQHRNGTASIAMGNLGAYVGPEAASTASHHPTPWVGAGSGKAATGGTKSMRSPSKKDDASSDVFLGEDQSRLLPPVIVPQVGHTRKCCCGRGASGWTLFWVQRKFVSACPVFCVDGPWVLS